MSAFAFLVFVLYSLVHRGAAGLDKPSPVLQWMSNHKSWPYEQNAKISGMNDTSQGCQCLPKVFQSLVVIENFAFQKRDMHINALSKVILLFNNMY